MSAGNKMRGPRASLAAAHAAAAAPAMDRKQIEEIVQSVVVSLRGDLTAADLSLYQELEGLARFIQSAKAEIAALRPDEIQNEHLPSAADELDAIVGATEDATGTILDSVEKIEAIAQKIENEQGAQIADIVTKIYEACNFQDITGQRITKVVKTLKQIENKVAALIGAFGDEIAREKARAAAAAAESQPAAVTPTDKPTDEDLLNGPQLPGNANSQADIDALFGRS
jgi:chemotaxis protein CheZ